MTKKQILKRIQSAIRNLSIQRRNNGGIDDARQTLNALQRDLESKRGKL